MSGDDESDEGAVEMRVFDDDVEKDELTELPDADLGDSNDVPIEDKSKDELYLEGGRKGLLLGNGFEFVRGVTGTLKEDVGVTELPCSFSSRR